MVHLLADDTPLSLLASLVEPAVIYDETGATIIGHYSFVDLEHGKRLYETPLTHAEIEEIDLRAMSRATVRPVRDIIREFEESNVDSNGAHSATTANSLKSS